MVAHQGKTNINIGLQSGGVTTYINWPDLNCTNSREGNKISYCRAFIYIYCEVTGACCHETVKPRRAKIRIIKVEKKCRERGRKSLLSNLLSPHLTTKKQRGSAMKPQSSQHFSTFGFVFDAQHLKWPIHEKLNQMLT